MRISYILTQSELKINKIPLEIHTLTENYVKITIPMSLTTKPYAKYTTQNGHRSVALYSLHFRFDLFFINIRRFPQNNSHSYFFKNLSKNLEKR